MTDGTKADGSLAGRQCSPVLGDQWLQKQILFYCVSLIIVLFYEDQRTYLFIIYVFSLYKRLMCPIRYSSI